MITYPFPPSVHAFSTTRQGGCSSGAYASLNCTPYTGDDPASVRRNQELLLERLPGCHRLVIPYQTHDTRCLPIDPAFLQLSAAEQQERLQGVDALLTCEKNVCIAISTADCVPLLLYDAAHGVVAAVHSGWRGTVKGILPQTLQLLQQQFGTCGSHLYAAIGPAISLETFEVGPEVYQAFHDAGFPMDQLARWKADSRHWHIDLPAACHYQLASFGVPGHHIHQSGLCTYSQPETFFSARRHGIHSGRILSGIYLTSFGQSPDLHYLCTL